MFKTRKFHVYSQKGSEYYMMRWIYEYLHHSYFKLTKNGDPDKYKYSGYGIGFYLRESFTFGNGLVT